MVLVLYTLSDNALYLHTVLPVSRRILELWN